MPQQEHDLVALAPGQGELAGLLEPFQALVGVRDLRDGGGKGASGIALTVGSMEARHGLDQTGLALRGKDEIGASLLECRLIENPDRHPADDQGHRHHDRSEDENCPVIAHRHAFRASR